MGPCPIHCRVSVWTPYSACTKSCGSGTKSRSRVILTNPLHDGDECPHLTDTTECEIQPCPVDCVYGQWGAWGACSASCGADTATPFRKRSRVILTPAAWGGIACPTTEHTTTCNAFHCPVDCREAPWGSWGDCTATCSVGIKVRVRTIEVNPAYGGRECESLAGQTTCNAGPCPIHCRVSAWSEWDACDKSCGTGKQARRREILTNPLHSGDQCPFLVQDRECNAAPCPVDCEVSSWGGWHPTLGGGTVLTRERQITTVPQHGGTSCPALSEQDAELEHSWHKQCVKQHEKDVYYGWSVCTRACDGGYQYRYREHAMCSKVSAVRYTAMFREGRHCNMQSCGTTAVTSATDLDEGLAPSGWQPAYLRHNEGSWSTLKVNELSSLGLPVGQWQSFKKHA